MEKDIFVRPMIVDRPYNWNQWSHQKTLMYHKNVVCWVIFYALKAKTHIQ